MGTPLENTYLRRFRVRIDIELRIGRHVSMMNSSAHKRNAPDGGFHFRIQMKKHGDIGQGSQRRDGHILVCLQQISVGFHSMFFLHRIDDFGYHCKTVHATVAMSMGLHFQFSLKGLMTPLEKWNRFFNGLQNQPRIVRDSLHMVVATHGAHPFDVKDLFFAAGHKNGHGIVVAWIAVDDQLIQPYDLLWTS